MIAAMMRRLVVLVLLLALVSIAASGLSGLLERALDTGTTVVDDRAGLALALALTLVGTPSAAALWWWQRRSLTDPAERASLLWALYVMVMTVVALVVSVTAAASAVASAVDGVWRPDQVATAIVWLPVLLWHRGMLRGRASAPTRLPGVATEMAILYGLIVAAGGAVGALSGVFAEAFADVARVAVGTGPWFVPVLQSLVWCASGAAVWWWQRRDRRADGAATAFGSVVLVVVITASAATALFALGTIWFVMLRLLTADAPVAEALAPLDTALAASSVGGIVWAFHAQALVARSATVLAAARLAVAGVALLGAASGVGVVVNALLASIGASLLGGHRTLLLGGVSAIVVGAPAWWAAWRPERGVTAADAASPGRRVYLVVVFGASAIVALVTALLIGYRLFEALLSGVGGLIELIRAPLGLLSATLLVSAYHFAIWRRDRRLAAADGGSAARVERIVLVSAGDAEALASRLRSETGARVSVWRAADAAALIDDADLVRVVGRIREAPARRVLVVGAESGTGARVVPLSG